MKGFLIFAVLIAATQAALSFSANIRISGDPSITVNKKNRQKTKTKKKKKSFESPTFFRFGLSFERMIEIEIDCIHFI